MLGRSSVAGDIVGWCSPYWCSMPGPEVVKLVEHHGLAALAIVGGLAVVGFTWWWMRKSAPASWKIKGS